MSYTFYKVIIQLITLVLFLCSSVKWEMLSFCSQSDEVSTILWIQNNFIEIVKKEGNFTLEWAFQTKNFSVFCHRQIACMCLNMFLMISKYSLSNALHEDFFWRSMITKKKVKIIQFWNSVNQRTLWNFILKCAKNPQCNLH